MVIDYSGSEMSLQNVSGNFCNDWSFDDYLTHDPRDVKLTECLSKAQEFHD